MSWLEHSKSRSRLLKGAAVAVIASVLGFGVSGCGFHPMYATSSTGASLTDVMKAVQIAPIPSRVGQRLRNELIFGATGGGESSSPSLSSGRLRFAKALEIRSLRIQALQPDKFCSSMPSSDLSELKTTKPCLRVTARPKRLTTSRDSQEPPARSTATPVRSSMPKIVRPAPLRTP